MLQEERCTDKLAICYVSCNSNKDELFALYGNGECQPFFQIFTRNGKVNALICRLS